MEHPSFRIQPPPIQTKTEKDRIPDVKKQIKLVICTKAKFASYFISLVQRDSGSVRSNIPFKLF